MFRDAVTAMPPSGRNVRLIYVNTGKQAIPIQGFKPQQWGERCGSIVISAGHAVFTHIFKHHRGKTFATQV
jgi:hypothetical protein